MERWYQLKHPHVEQLLGACYVGERFFLSRECGDFEDLSTALANPNDAWYKYTKKPTLHGMMWRMLYKAALGLQFLHDRGIVHGNLSGNVVIPDGNVVKLRGFFWGRRDDRSQTPVVGGARVNAEASKFAADVHDFSWCILEAVCGPQYREFNNEHSCWKAVASPKWEWNSEHPLKAFSSTQWSFLKSVLHQDSRDRISITDMVRQLKAFAIEEEYGSLYQGVVAKQDEAPITSSSSQLHVKTLLEVTRVALESIDASFSVVWSANKQVFGRLTDIYTQLKNMDSELRMKLWTSYRPILEKFHDAVTSNAEEQSAMVRLASSRQASERNYQFNLDLDRLCKLGSLSLTRRDHDWQIQWNQNSTSLIELLSTKVREEAQTTRGDNDVNEARAAELAYLHFEHNQRHSRYTSDQLSAIKSTIQAIHHDRASIEATDPPWFIPPYEVDFEHAPF